MTATIQKALVCLMLLVGISVGIAHADEVHDTMKAWLDATKSQGTIAPGTKISMANWQQYKQFMPVGMIALFEGKYYWKMPADVEMDVVPTVNHPLPKAFVEASEKYGSQTRVVRLPDGRMNIENFITGWPFPHPSEPDMGYKILMDIWFYPGPYVAVVSPDGGDASFCTIDRFDNQACSKSSAVYRQLAFNWTPGVPKIDPRANGAWFTQFLMLDKPEQSKYTASLTIFWQDLPKDEDDYVFVPALRRSLRLSASSRCAPIFGSDMVKDDSRVGYDGGTAVFNADFLGTRKILANSDLTRMTGKFPAEYDMPLGWAKPSWGGWQVRPSHVLDVRRIPGLRSGYCYGSKIMYVDAQFLQQMFEEIYDANLKLWKILAIQRTPDVLFQGEGLTPLGGGVSEQFWDVQNDHASHIFTANPDGMTDGLRLNSRVPARYDDIHKYSTPGGLMSIMR